MQTVQESHAATAAPVFPLVVVSNQPSADALTHGGDDSDAIHDHASAALAFQLLERVAAPAQNEHSTFKLGTIDMMFRSAMNVRDVDGNVSDLLPLIASKGLLQNLIGYEEVIDGQTTGRIAVVAGGRRLKCLGFLTGHTECTDDYALPFFGIFPADYAIPYLVVSEAEAIAISLAENSGRKGMHAADIAGAMMALFKAGAAVEDISVSFGIEVKTVRQYLKLANLAPSLFALYRKDELKFDQVKALAITDDHTKQLSVIESLGMRAAEWNIRSMLSKHHMTAADALAKFVTVKAYEEAGGKIEQDLFSQNDTLLLTDVPLLHKLAGDKLAKKQARVQKEGHAWVETRISFTEADKAEFAAVRTVTRKPTESEDLELTQIAAKLDELYPKRDTAYNALDSFSDGGEEDGEEDGEEKDGNEDDAGDGAPETDADREVNQLSEAIRDLEARRKEIKGAFIGPHDGDKALAGAVVTIDRDGQAKVVPGLIRSEDKSKMEKLVKDKADDEAPAKADHSDRLTHVLTSHRTVAFQAELMLRPDVALVLATYSLVRVVLVGHQARWRTTDACKIAQTCPRLAEEVGGTKADLAIAEKRAALTALLPQDVTDDKLLTWLLTQPQATVLDMLAFCTAVSCDLTLSRETSDDKSFKPLANAVKLDMRNWWTANTETYFKHVPKQRLMAVVQQAVSIEKSVPLEKMKKGEAADAATVAVAGAGWLPDMLRVA